MARKAISKKRRFEIFKRDEFRCQYCGETPPKVKLHVDHITPVAKGGGNEEENLITSCDACNMGKGATPLEVKPASIADRAKELAEREAQLAGYQKVFESKRQRLEEDAWEVADMFVNHFGDDGIRKDWFRSIKTFVDRLLVCEVIDSMEFALAVKGHSKQYAFKYFCGICWNKIKEPAHG